MQQNAARLKSNDTAERELGLAESGCYLLRWAAGIGPWPRQGIKGSGSKWFEYRTERFPDSQGFRIQLWNRLPWAETTLSLATNDLALPAPTGPKGAVHRTVCWLRLGEPAYRVSAELEVKWESDRIVVTTSKPLRLRLFHSAISPELTNENGVDLIRRDSEGSRQAVTEGVISARDFIDWPAAAGQYEITSAETRP